MPQIDYTPPPLKPGQEIPPIPTDQAVIIPGWYRTKRGEIVWVDAMPPRPNRKLRRQSAALSRHPKKVKP